MGTDSEILLGVNIDHVATLRQARGTPYPDPVEAAWSLFVDKKEVAGDKKTFNVPPGEAQEWPVSFKTPKTSGRTEGELILTCSRGGKEVTSWDAYRNWLTKVQAPEQRRSLPDPALFSFKGYRSWAEKVRRDWDYEE